MLTNTGTLYYKAPEMFLGGGYDNRVDIWAVGIMLYQMIDKQRRTPFESVYHHETITNILKGEVNFQAEIWSKHPFAKDLIIRLLKKNK